MDPTRVTENPLEALRPARPPVVMAWTTVSNLTTARELATKLVEERLVACVQLSSAMTSIYRWQGKLCEESEVQMVFKTNPANWPKAEARLRELHPYECPEILFTVMQCNPEYGAWVSEQVISDELRFI